MTKKEIEEKSRRNKIIIGLVLTGIMVLSSMGYAFFSGEREDPSEKMNYNGVEFIRDSGGMWIFEIEGAQFYTRFNPNETENISVPILKTAGEYTGKTLYFLGDGPLKREVLNNFYKKIITKYQDGCIKGYENACGNETPIKDCSTDNIIIIEDSEEIKISQDENCIFIKSPYSEQERAADAFMFKIFGIK